ncbi:hypothetical protein CYMTET_20532, partial [Cymbomonas tetramitiformis]
LVASAIINVYLVCARFGWLPGAISVDFFSTLHPYFIQLFTNSTFVVASYCMECARRVAMLCNDGKNGGATSSGYHPAEAEMVLDFNSPIRRSSFDKTRNNEVAMDTPSEKLALVSQEEIGVFVLEEE